MKMKWLTWVCWLTACAGSASAGTLADATVSCLLEPGQISATGSPVPGVVGKIYRERGDRVRKGDKLFELESSVEQASLKIAEARWHFIQGKWERNQLLIQENVLSAQEVAELRHDLSQAEAALGEARAILERRMVYSPLDGVVVERMASVGEYVKDNAVLRVAALDTLHAELTLRAEARGSIRVGQMLRLKVDGFQAPLSGRVTVVDPHVDAASATLAARVLVNNASGRVPAGLQCRL